MESFVCHNPKLGEIESLNGYNWRPCQDRTTEESTWHILRYAEGKIEPATAGWEQMQPTVRDRGTVVPNPEADLRARLLDAERQSTELISEMERANEEAKRVREELQQALGEIQVYKNEVEGLRAQYEKLSTQSELDKLRALDLMRQESEKRLANKRTRADDNLPSSAVGPTLLALQIEGVQVSALVDTGSQSTIISRQVLQGIGKHLHSQGKPLPQVGETIG